jgi:hypothetical protein
MKLIQSLGSSATLRQHFGGELKATVFGMWAFGTVTLLQLIVLENAELGVLFWLLSMERSRQRYSVSETTDISSLQPMHKNTSLTLS